MKSKILSSFIHPSSLTSHLFLTLAFLKKCFILAEPQKKEFGMSEERDTFALNIPRSRPLTSEDFGKLVNRLRDMYRCLVSTHQSFAHLIRMEEGKDCLRVAFLAPDEDIPQTLIIVTDRSFRFVNCMNGDSVDVTDLDGGAFRLVNLIRLTAQFPVLRASNEVAELMARLYARPSRSSPVASNVLCVHV